jgi:predicted RNA-binding protein with PIN domain
MPTRLLIDGYNLLFASDVFASLAGPPTLERTRTALLQFVSAALEPKLRSRTTIVFDATQAPPHLPHELTFDALRVLFSRHGQDADSLLEDLIAAERSPRELLVISSDHRVQRAARQQGAKFADSDLWLRDLKRAKLAVNSTTSAHPTADSTEIQKWLTEFGNVDPHELEIPEPPPRTPNPSPPINIPTAEPKASKPVKRPAPRPIVNEKPANTRFNPFPPGYADDVNADDDVK